MKPDNSLLNGINLDQFSETERQKIVEKLYAKLEDQVGNKMASMVSDEQFIQFELLVDQADEGKLDEWLSANTPDYDQMVEAILEQLKKEIAASPQAFLAD